MDNDGVLNPDGVYKNRKRSDLAMENQSGCAKIYRYKNGTLLSKLTIVMLTYNRQQYALRNMQFWSCRGPTMHVLDGSDVPIKKHLLQKVGTNIHYHHLPESIIDRVSYILPKLNTEYTILIADDEFFLPKGLERILTELENNTDLVSCAGRCLWFTFESKDVVGHPFYTIQEGYSLVQEEASERMLYHMTEYTPSIIYSVVRTDVWKKSMRPTIKKDFFWGAQLELQFELSVSFFGKSKVIPVLFWLKSGENVHSSTPESIALCSNPFPVWWRDPEKESERHEFLNIMTTSLSMSNDSESELEEIITKALDAKAKNSGIFLSPYSYFRSKMKALIAHNLPPKIKQYLKRKFSIGYLDLPLIEAARQLAMNEVNVDFGDIEKIRATIVLFHEERLRQYGGR